MVQAVFFDLVGTLIRAARPIGEQYAECARRHGATEAEPAEMENAFRRAMRNAPPMAFPGEPKAVRAAERDWWADLVRGVVEQCGLRELNGSRFDVFFADLYEHFTTADAWALYPDARPALEGLRERGLGVGLITNYDTRVYRVIDALGLSALLDSVTIPAVAGAAKPALAIFVHALGRHGIAPREAIYVGDEIGDDYEGARGAGMRAVLIDRGGECKDRRVTVITDLRQVTTDD
jgi:putative hydrolase of the HAD superfamily